MNWAQLAAIANVIYSNHRYFKEKNSKSFRRHLPKRFDCNRILLIIIIQTVAKRIIKKKLEEMQRQTEFWISGVLGFFVYCILARNTWIKNEFLSTNHFVWCEWYNGESKIIWFIWHFSTHLLISRKKEKQICLSTYITTQGAWT